MLAVQESAGSVLLLHNVVDFYLLVVNEVSVANVLYNNLEDYLRSADAV